MRRLCHPRRQSRRFAETPGAQAAKNRFPFWPVLPARLAHLVALAATATEELSSGYDMARLSSLSGDATSRRPPLQVTVDDALHHPHTANSLSSSCLTPPSPSLTWTGIVMRPCRIVYPGLPQTMVGSCSQRRCCRQQTPYRESHCHTGSSYQSPSPPFFYGMIACTAMSSRRFTFPAKESNHARTT